YISFQVEMVVEQPAHPSTSAVGLDTGVSKLATLSDGTVFEPDNSFKQNQGRVARLHRQLARNGKVSAHWE
ncbi:transposase, partial [Klebsiella pneumoniae]|uniref:transposase n=1 Tax=Klebsiella pneumoniae TaxID=573 RepID=UPI00396A9E8B